MGSEILVYLRLGYEHILDVRGWDHILFVVVLTLPWSFARWRGVLVQVTAFTVGHSITLALATLDWIRVSSSWVEFLIPITILVTALVQMRAAFGAGRGRERGTPEGTTPDPGSGAPRGLARRFGGATWLLALGFGLIHGLGFSNFLRALLGAESSIAIPLLSFNVGLEAGQIVVVLAVLAANAVLDRLPGPSVPRRVGILSTAIALIALYLSVIRLPF